MESKEKEFLKEAYNFLENPSWITRLTDYIGKPIEFGIERLPEKTKLKIAKISKSALTKSLKSAHYTLLKNQKYDSFEHQLKANSISRLGHNTLTMTAGAIGGFFGEAGLIVELPLTTTLIMRSILSQGQTYNSFNKEELIANAIYVFSLGSSHSNQDDEMDSAYYTSRVMMDISVKKAAEYLAVNGPKTVLKNIEKGTAPALLELISTVANRFNITVSEKMLAESLPIVGAIGGAGINLVFTDFFTLSANYHFGIKHLEKKYGEGYIKNIYIEMKKQEKVEVA